MILDFVNSLLTDIKHHVKPGEEFSQQVLGAHQEVFDAIVKGDGDAAAASMLKHICQVEEELETIRQQSEETAPSKKAS
jgi:GntR family transcriptional repressor for pyruvate dehydrogenase complex